MVPNETRSHALRDWAPWLCLVVLVPLLFYSSMVFRGWEPKSPDTQAVSPFGVWGKATTQALGEVPSWYPYIFCGMPSYGSFLYTPRSPINALGYLAGCFPSNRGARYVLFFIVAGLGATFFFRRQGLSRGASTAGGLLYSMTPYFLGNVSAGHATKLEALCLVPLFLLSLDWFLERPRLVSAALLGWSLALLGWAHHPQIAFYALLIGFLYAAGTLLWIRVRPRPAWVSALGFGLFAAVLAACLLADPYLAVREYAPHSIRGESGVSGALGGGAGWDYATMWSFHPRELLSFVFPAWFGLQGETYWGEMPFTQSTHYFGIVPLFLAVLGFMATRSPRRVLWLTISLIVLLIGFGRFLPVIYGPMFAAVPFFNKFRVPSMIYGLLPLCLGWLVGTGVDAVVHSVSESTRGTRGKKDEARGPLLLGNELRGAWGRWGPRVLIVSWILVGLAFVVTTVLRGSLLAGGVFVKAGDPTGGAAAALHAERFGLLQQSLGLGLVLVALLSTSIEAARRRWLPLRFLTPVLVALILVDIVWIDRQFYHPEPKDPPGASPVPGAARFLAAQERPFRVFPVGPLFSSNALGHERIESIGGYQPAKLRCYQDLIDSQLLSNSSVLAMLNVRYVVSPGPLDLHVPPISTDRGYVYALPGALPRVWSVDRLEAVRGTDEMMSRLRSADFFPEVVALFYENDPLPAERSFARARVESIEQDPARLRVRAEAGGPALLMISEIWYPPGRRAFLDGQPLPLYRANHVLCAARIPAGEHEIVITTEDEARSRGAEVSRIAGGVGLLALVVGGLLDRRRIVPRTSVA